MYILTQMLLLFVISVFNVQPSTASYEYRAPVNKTVQTTVILYTQPKTVQTSNSVVNPSARNDKALIKEVATSIYNHEGFSPTKYKDGHGWTIGYGSHNRGYDVITKQEARLLVVEDIKDIITEFDKTYGWWRNMPHKCQAALVELAYNLGLNGLNKFERMMAFLEKGDYANASYELLYKNGERREYRTKFWRDVGDRAVTVASYIHPNGPSAFTGLAT